MGLKKIREKIGTVEELDRIGKEEKKREEETKKINGIFTDKKIEEVMKKNEEKIVIENKDKTETEINKELQAQKEIDTEIEKLEKEEEENENDEEESETDDEIKKLCVDCGGTGLIDGVPCLCVSEESVKEPVKEPVKIKKPEKNKEAKETKKQEETEAKRGYEKIKEAIEKDNLEKKKKFLGRVKIFGFGYRVRDARTGKVVDTIDCNNELQKTRCTKKMDEIDENGQKKFKFDPFLNAKFVGFSSYAGINWRIYTKRDFKQDEIVEVEGFVKESGYAEVQVI